MWLPLPLVNNWIVNALPVWLNPSSELAVQERQPPAPLVPWPSAVEVIRCYS